MTQHVVVDVGSTTTKAILFSSKNEDGWSFVRHEAPTTVEAPHADVTIGLLQALRGLERAAGERLVAGGEPRVPLLATSSAGGGLAMVVTGLMRNITSSSAERAALGAGATVLDTVALDDGRVPYRKVEALRAVRPDMLLLAGGFDGAALGGPVLLAELVRQADLRPKLDPTAKLPVLYAGNRNARDLVEETLGGRYLYRAIENLRPGSDRENLEPARAAIHEIFMEHVMSHAPGYPVLTGWVGAPILPTPSAFARILALASRTHDRRILAVDIGGATTDVFTAARGEVQRTVSANLGMSYSALNVADLAGLGALRELLGFEIEDADLLNRIGNKLLLPTSLPATPEQVQVERALATVAVRLAVREHLAVLEGIPLSRDEEELSLRSYGRKRRRRRRTRPPAGLRGYDLVIGSGGILSHSPREAALSMLLNATDPVGATEIAVDRAFMFPHLGVLSESDPDLALALFENLGLVNLGTLVAAEGDLRSKRARLYVEGASLGETVPAGEVRSLSLPTGPPARFRVRARGLEYPDRWAECSGRLILDARGRPPSRRGLDLLPSSSEPPPRRDVPSAEPPIREGRIEVRRELAVEGEVAVSPGEEVRTDTLVARCTRTFPRPFFVNPVAALDVSPEELAQHLEKGVGHEIRAGEILASRSSGLLDRKRFESPVSGRIERILPDGTLVIRETAKTPEGVRSILAADELGVDPWRLEPYLRVKEGEEVQQGQPLARILEGTEYKVSAAPSRGVVERIDLDFGIVLIAPQGEELEIRAWLPGVVEETTARGARIAAHGLRIRGAWGWGGEASGPLVVDEARAGCVAVFTEADGETLRELVDRKVEALVTGGMDLADVRAAAPAFPVLLTEGFGRRPLPLAVLRALEAREGRLALVDATTELRVGVRRPVVIVPDPLP